MPLTKWALWRSDIPFSMDLEDVASQSFQPHDEGEGLFGNGNSTIWFKFQIENLSRNNSLKLFLITDNGVHNANLHFFENNRWNILMAGGQTDYNQLAFKENFWAIPINIEAGSTQVFYFELYIQPGYQAPSHSILLVSPASEAIQRTNIRKGIAGIQNFNSFFLGCILIFALLTFIYYAANKDKAYLYYSLYLVCLFIFYIKNFEIENRSLIPFSFFAKWHSNIETLSTYASFAFYTQFIRYFLDIPDVSKRLNKLLNYVVWFFTAMLPLDLVVQMTLGSRTSLYLSRYLYIPFTLFSIYILFHLWKNKLSPYARFIIIGTLLLLLGIIPFRLAQTLDIEFAVAVWGSLRVFYMPWGGELYWYHTKTGLLLEMVCFMLGLAWKTKEERIELIQLASRLKMLENNHSNSTQSKKEVPPKTHELQIAQADSFLKKVENIIEGNYTSDQYSPYQLAADLNFSYSHCAHLIKKKTGLSISLYIQQFRLQRAKELLKSTDLPIKQVAYQSGFNNPAYFSRLFKETAGTSASDWRKNGNFQ